MLGVTTQRWTLTVVCVATAMLMLDIAVVNTALSDIASDLHTGLDGLQWVIDAYTVALAAVVLSAGSLADRIGRRRVFAAGLLLFTVTSAACAAATDILVLDIARAVQGLGAAAMFATSLALLADAFPSFEERAGALAAYGASIGAAFAFGPLVGGALTSAFGWRAIFLINLPIGLFALYVTRRQVRESRDEHPRPIDWPGQFTLGVGLLTLVLALLRGNEDGWSSPTIVALFAVAVVALAAFLAIEARVRVPMLPLGAFRNRAFTAAQIAAFGISASFFAVFLYTTIYLQQVLGLSAIESGLVYLPGTLIMLVVSGATAQMADKVPARLLVCGGLAVVGVGQLLGLMVGVDSSWAMLLPSMVVALVGTGVFNPSVSALALGSLPAEDAGLAAGINDTFRQAGIAVGVAALGALVPAADAFSGDKQSYVDGLHVALIAGGVLALVCAAAAWALLRPATVTAPAAAASEAAAA